MKKNFPKEITNGDKYFPAMKIQTQAEADEYFELCVQHSINHFAKSRKEAEKLERVNLLYFAGYYNDSVILKRVERLFGSNGGVKI